MSVTLKLAYTTHSLAKCAKGKCLHREVKGNVTVLTFTGTQIYDFWRKSVEWGFCISSVSNQLKNYHIFTHSRHPFFFTNLHLQALWFTWLSKEQNVEIMDQKGTMHQQTRSPKLFCYEVLSFHKEHCKMAEWASCCTLTHSTSSRFQLLLQDLQMFPIWLWDIISPLLQWVVALSWGLIKLYYVKVPKPPQPVPLHSEEQQLYTKYLLECPANPNPITFHKPCRATSFPLPIVWPVNRELHSNLVG